MSFQSFFLSLFILLNVAFCERKTTVSNNSSATTQTQKEDAAAPAGNRAFTAAFYNIENLYDTFDDTNKDDNEFLPNSKNAWTSERYQTKLTHLAEVIGAMGQNGMPDIMGLCEVENKKVLEDLLKKTPLPDNSGIVHFDSPDERGVDVALLYNPKTFSVTSSEPLAVKFDFDAKDRTRDVLYVKGKVGGNDDLHVFINHWPSRREGQAQSEPKRMAAAQVVREKLNTIFAKDPAAKVLIMGDLNDGPTDKPIIEGLGAKNNTDNMPANTLYNESSALSARNEGTITYKGKWDLFDQIIVSNALLQAKKGLRAKPDAAAIFKDTNKVPNLLYFDKGYNDSFPNRTYGGDKYHGGYSDHLPTYINMQY